MRFPLDPGAVMGYGVWETLKRLGAMVSSVWIGCLCAVISLTLRALAQALLAGRWDIAGELLESMVTGWMMAPLVVFLSAWGLVTIPLCAYVYYQMLQRDCHVAWMWLTMTAACGMMVMTSGVSDHMKPAEVAFAWLSYVVLLASLALGVLLQKGWQRNSQVHHLQQIKVENEMRRAELEAKFGTHSFGQGNVDGLFKDQ